MTEGAATEVAAVGTHCGCADLRAGDFTETKGREGRAMGKQWRVICWMDKLSGGQRLLFAQWTRC